MNKKVILLAALIGTVIGTAFSMKRKTTVPPGKKLVAVSLDEVVETLSDKEPREIYNTVLDHQVPEFFQKVFIRFHQIKGMVNQN